MSLRALRTLHAIARYGSFARAGAAIGLTQSAVSLQVKALEEQFGARLFDRSRRLPVLTEAGQIVLEKSDSVLALYDKISEALSDEQSLAGRLRLGAIQTALTGVVPDALIELNQLHPRIRVHVAAGMSVELSRRVAAGELDAAITTQPVRPHASNLVWTPLYEDRFWVVVSKEHQDREIHQILADLPFIRFDSRAWAGRAIDQELQKMRIHVHEEMVLDSTNVILQMVEKGLGAAIVPLSENQRRNLHLACLPFGKPQLTRHIVLLERQGREGGRLAAAVVQAIHNASEGD